MGGGFIRGPNPLSNQRVSNLVAHSIHRVVIDLQMDVQGAGGRGQGGGAALLHQEGAVQFNYRETKPLRIIA